MSITWYRGRTPDLGPGSLVEFKTQCQPRTAGPSDDGLKFGQFAGIVQTCSDLVAREIGKFRDNIFCCFASGQVPEHKAYRNTCSF
jgi:hypothetical protein